jgi:hypothetical protein
LDGHALKVCKYAYSLVIQRNGIGSAHAEDLGRKMLVLANTQPEVATALGVMLDAMLNQSSSDNEAGPGELAPEI